MVCSFTEESPFNWTAGLRLSSQEEENEKHAVRKPGWKCSHTGLNAESLWMMHSALNTHPETLNCAATGMLS